LDVIAFFDASAVIYFVEGAEPFASRVRVELARLAKRYPNLGAAVSRLSWLECRVKPARDDDHDTLSHFDSFFARPNLSWVELTREVVELATEVRIRHRLKTPDALQAACCLQLGAEHVFITGDAVFKKVGSLNARVLH
jgi:predicted nucleic acid-binding protein